MFAISPTDVSWFNFLKTESLNENINFWTPTPWNISKLKGGDKLYFMLKAPIRKIGGYGEFVEYKNMSVDEAWNEFGYKNGTSSRKELIYRLDKYKSARSSDTSSVSDSKIGCIVLSNVVYLDEDEFLDLESFTIDFSRFIVKIKYYNEPDILSSHFDLEERYLSPFELIEDTVIKLKKSRLVAERKGQGRFRAVVTSAYDNKCSITQESTPELLEAAHIQPYMDENSNHVKNGILLRADFHKLYDNHLMFIDENYSIHISPICHSNYYKSFDGKKMTLPTNPNHSPSIEALLSRKSDFRYE